MEAIVSAVKAGSEFNVLGFLVNLLLGAIVGGFMGVYLTIRAQRPNLVLSGIGSGNSAKDGWSCSAQIANRPSILGMVLRGEPADHVTAHLRVIREGPNLGSWGCYWNNGESSFTLNPGYPSSITLFTSRQGERGYSIRYRDSEPLITFDAPKEEFELMLRDRLGRTSKFRFIVWFNNAAKQGQQPLTVDLPWTFAKRWEQAISGLRMFSEAFRRKGVRR